MDKIELDGAITKGDFIEITGKPVKGLLKRLDEANTKEEFIKASREIDKLPLGVERRHLRRLHSRLKEIFIAKLAVKESLQVDYETNKLQLQLKETDQ